MAQVPPGDGEGVFTLPEITITPGPDPAAHPVAAAKAAATDFVSTQRYAAEPTILGVPRKVAAVGLGLGLALAFHRHIGRMFARLAG
jgi:hypothetical protein